MQTYGVPPGQIRTNLNVNVNKNIFYNMHRQTIMQSKNEDIDEILTNPENNKWDIDVSNTINDTLATITYLNKRVAESEYSTDLCYLDDTMCTNIYGRPVQLAISVDSQDHSQTLAFFVLEDKSKNGFLIFFISLKKMHQKTIRVMVVDRNEPQTQEIRQVYPETIIVFCLFHIRRNLLQHFTSKRKLIKCFDEMQYNFTKCEEFINMILKFIQENPKAEATFSLKQLLDLIEHWLPSILVSKGVYIKFNNNRSENLFGSFKQRYGFSLRTAALLIKQLLNNASLELTSSIASFQSTTLKYSDMFPFLRQKMVDCLGDFALSRKENEYNAFIKGEQNDHCVYCFLKIIAPSLALPCRHDMVNGTINLFNLNKRFFKVDICNNISPGKIIYRKSHNVSKSFKYTDIIAKIASYAAVADRNLEVQELFSEFFEKLNNVQGTIYNKGMPPSLTLSRRFQTHPSKNVILGGKPKEKGVRCCSKCHQPIHYATRCPLNKE